MLEPEIEKLAAEYGDDLRIAKLNVDENPQVAGKYQVLSIPTMMLVTNDRNPEGKRKSVFTMGFRPFPALKEWLMKSGFKPGSS